MLTATCFVRISIVTGNGTSVPNYLCTGPPKPKVTTGSVPWLPLQKNCWPKVLGSVVIQLYAGECTPSIDRCL